MIVHHRVGEWRAAAMNRQYRPAFNVGVPLTSAAVGLGGSFLWDGLLVIVPALALAAVYHVNFIGRKNRVRAFELQKPTKLTEQWVLELQDIYFHIPPEHKPVIDGLLNGAYQQIELGNINAVNPRLEKARALQKAIVRLNEQLDTRDDITAVDTHVRAIQRAIEA